MEARNENKCGVNNSNLAIIQLSSFDDNSRVGPNISSSHKHNLSANNHSHVNMNNHSPEQEKKLTIKNNRRGSYRTFVNLIQQEQEGIKTLSLTRSLKEKRNSHQYQKSENVIQKKKIFATLRQQSVSNENGKSPKTPKQRVK